MTTTPTTNITAIATPTKESIKAIFHDIFYLADDWMPTDEDMALLQKVFDAKDATTTHAQINVVDEYFRVDSKTYRVMTEGYIVFDGTAYFIKEDDAVEYLNANGVKCDTFTEAYEMAQRGEIDDCYFTEWYEHGYS